MARPIKNKDGHKKILDSAKLILTKQGIAELTTRNIAKASGYGLGSMYFYFDNVDDLILQINGSTIEDLFHELNRLDQKLKPGPTKLVKICQAYFDYVFDHKELWNTVMNYRRTGEEKSGAWYQAKINNMTRLVEHIIALSLKPGQKKEEMANILWAGMQGIWFVANRQGFKTTSREEAKKMVEILVKNLFKM